MKFKVGDIITNKAYFGEDLYLVHSIDEHLNTTHIFLDAEGRDEKIGVLVSRAQDILEELCELAFDNIPQVLDNKCRCPIFDLMSMGCKCGGV